MKDYIMVTFYKPRSLFRNSNTVFTIVAWSETLLWPIDELTKLVTRYQLKSRYSQWFVVFQVDHGQV